MTTSMILFGILLLAVGTYIIRYAGLSFNQHFTLQEKHQQLVQDAATTLLFSIAVLSTFFEGAKWTDPGKMIGVAVALYLIWKNYSLIKIILIAMLTTTIIRFIINYL